MKNFLFSVLTLFTLSTQAQTTPPSIAMLVKLYTDSNTAAINDYAHAMGFKGEAFGFSDVGNTYDYMHYTFASKDTLTKQHTYLSYTWGEHYPMFSNKLVSIEFVTNQKAIFNALVDELKGLGAIGEELKSADPGWIFYKYNGAYISTHINSAGNGHKYTILFGGGGW